MASRPAAAMPDPPGPRMPMICGDWAALWHRHRIDIDAQIASVLKPLAPHLKAALCLCSDGLRRVAAFRIIPGVLRLGRSSLPSPSHALWPCGSFSRAQELAI